MGMMCKRAFQLGEIHVHQIFKIPTQERLAPHRRAELLILNLTKKPKKIIFLHFVDILSFDEMGQSSAEIIAAFETILHKIRNSNIYMGGVLNIFSMDPTQIQTIGVHQFMKSCHIIYCFKMVTLENSVQASNNDIFKFIQKIARLNYLKLIGEPDLVE